MENSLSGKAAEKFDRAINDFEHYEVWWRVFGWTFRILTLIDKLRCLFAGHIVRRGEFISPGDGGHYQITPDYCRRCNALENEVDLEDGGIPNMLHGLLVEHIDRDGVVSRVFTWTVQHPGVLKRMPKWWEY